MSEIEYNAIFKNVQQLSKNCQEKHHHGLIFISCSKVCDAVNECDIEYLYNRIIHRNQVGDSALTKSYIALLEKLYQSFFKNFTGPKIMLDMNHESIDQMLHKIKCFLDNF